MQRRLFTQLKNKPHFSTRLARSGIGKLEWIVLLAVLCLLIIWFYTRHQRKDILDREEKAAITLHRLHDSQQWIKGELIIDEDGDRIGEFTSLSVLYDPLTFATLSPENLPELPLLTAADPGRGIYERDGYLYRVYLDTAASRQAVNNREQMFAVTAWPVEWGETGLRSFFITSEGHLFAREDAVGNGLDDSIELTELFSTGFDLNTIDQEVWILQDQEEAGDDNAPVE